MREPISKEEQAERSRFLQDAARKAMTDLGADDGGTLVATVADDVFILCFRGFDEYELVGLAAVLLNKAQAMHREHPCDFLTKVGAAIDALGLNSRDDVDAALGEAAGHA